MARPGRPERNRAARSFGQLRRFHHVINSDKVFGTHTDLVIGVDGVGSIVRKAVVGDDAAPVYAGYAAWRGLYPEVDLPNSAAETLRERFAFFNMHRSHILGYLVAGPDGSLEAGRRRYNWVWYRRLSDADGSLVRALTDASGR